MSEGFGTGLRLRWLWKTALITLGLGTAVSNSLAALGRGLFLPALGTSRKAQWRALPSWFWCLFFLLVAWHCFSAILGHSSVAWVLHDISLFLLFPVGVMISRERSLSVFLRLWIWFGAIEALAVIWHAGSGSSLASLWEPGVRIWAETRPSGFLRSAPTSGQVLAILLPLTLLIKGRNGIEKWLFPLVGLLMGFALILTETRSAWVSASLLTALAGVSRFGWRRVLLGYLISGLIVWLMLPPLLKERALSIVDTKSSWARCRVVLWETGVILGRQHPIVGIGPGRFAAIYVREALPLALQGEHGALLTASDRADVAQHAHPHNDFIQSWAATGIPGLVIFISFVFSVFVCGVRNWRSLSLNRESISRVGLLIFAGTLLVGLVDQSAFDPVRGNLFWFAAGLASGRGLVAGVGRKLF